MRFSVQVGNTDKHLVEFNFNQLYGTLVIRVDNQAVFQSKRIFNEPVREVYHFVIDGADDRELVQKAFNPCAFVKFVSSPALKAFPAPAGTRLKQFRLAGTD